MEATQQQCSVNCANLLCRQKNSIHTVRIEYSVAVLRKENELEELPRMLPFGAAVTHGSQFCESRFMVQKCVCSVLKTINVTQQVSSTVKASVLCLVENGPECQ
jgi:hypothetical protein